MKAAVPKSRTFDRQLLFKLYVYSIGLAGIVICSIAITKLFDQHEPLNLLLLFCLFIVADLTSLTMPNAIQSGVAYHVGPAISIAIIPQYGYEISALMIVLSSVLLWAIKPSDDQSWQKSLRQLLFNSGMLSLSTTAGGVVLLSMLGQGNSFLSLIPLLAWPIAATVTEITNFIVLAVVLRLQQGSSFSIRELWREDMWATALGIIVSTIGGGLLSFAISEYDWIGITIFFLPITLSSFAFQLYLRHMQTHLDNLEEIISARTADLELVNTEKDAFLAVLTHDMKSPLQTINVYANMIQQSPDLAQKKPRMIGNILRAQETLLEIVNNILDLEKLKAEGAMLLELSNFNIVELTDYVSQSLQGVAAQKEITIDNQAGSADYIIRGDRLKIERVLTNLVSNAVKYTPNGGMVEIETKATTESIMISVKDNGLGIPTADLPHIFDRYHRVEKHQNAAAGTGLGLAIARAIVESHGGTIHADSIEGEGSTFLITLPFSK